MLRPKITWPTTRMNFIHIHVYSNPTSIWLLSYLHKEPSLGLVIIEGETLWSLKWSWKPIFVHACVIACLLEFWWTFVALVSWSLAYSINLHIWLWSLSMLPTNSTIYEKIAWSLASENSIFFFRNKGVAMWPPTTTLRSMVFGCWASTNFISYCEMHPSSHFFSMPNYYIHVGFVWVSWNARLPQGNIYNKLFIANSWSSTLQYRHEKQVQLKVLTQVSWELWGEALQYWNSAKMAILPLHLKF